MCNALILQMKGFEIPTKTSQTWFPRGFLVSTADFGIATRSALTHSLILAFTNSFDRLTVWIGDLYSCSDFDGPTWQCFCSLFQPRKVALRVKQSEVNERWICSVWVKGPGPKASKVALSGLSILLHSGKTIPVWQKRFL